MTFRSLVSGVCMAAGLFGLVVLGACSSDEAASGTEPTASDPGAMVVIEQPAPPESLRPVDGAPPVMAPAPGVQEGGTDATFERLRQDRSLAQERDLLLVDQYLRSAERYLERLDYARAEESALRALQVRPEHQGALEMLRKARALQGAPLESMEDVNRFVVSKRSLIREQQTALVNDHFARANQAYARGDFAAAKIELENAELIMRFDPYQTDFGPLRNDVMQMLSETARQLDTQRRSEEQEQMRAAYQKLRDEEMTRLARDEEKIRGLMNEAFEAFDRKDFDQSEFLARQVLRIRAGFGKARELVEWSRRARHAEWRDVYYAEKRERFRQWMEDVREHQIPYTDLLQWPAHERWEEITTMRRRSDAAELSLTESEQVRYIRHKLDNETVSWTFGGETPKTFLEVMQDIRNQRGVNIVVDPEVVSTKGEEQINIELREMVFGRALKTLLAGLDLVYTFRNDVLWVTSKEKAHGTPLPRIYEVRDLTISLANFQAPQLKLRPGAAGETATKAIWGEEKERSQDTLPERLVELVRENVAPETWEMEGFAININAGNLVAVTTPEVHAAIEDFLNELRRFTKIIVHVESRFVSIRQGFLSELGVDWRGLDGTGPGTLALLDDVTNGPDDNASAGLDNSGPGMPFATSLSPSAGAFYNVGHGNGDIRGRTENIFTRLLGGFLTNTGGATVAFTYLDDVEVQALFRAIEKTTQANVITAPRLTIYNNQRANLTIVNQVSYVKDYDVEVAQTAFIADPLVDIVQDGLVLDVRPTVSHDRKYVTLELRPTVATLGRPIPTFVTSLAGLTTPVIIELPEIQISSAATTVRCPDGGYIVIGGLKNISTVDRRSEVPILSDIPILSFFFSKKGRSDEIDDLIIVLHVNIIDLAHEENTLMK